MKESEVQDILYRTLKNDGGWGDDCKKEVIVSGGRIDIITPRFIIEIKTYKQWRAAIGQIITYEDQVYRSEGIHRDKYIYLFDFPNNFNGLNNIIESSRRQDVGCLIHTGMIDGLFKN